MPAANVSYFVKSLQQGLMIAVICMGVVMDAAVAVIQQVGYNDEHHGKRQDPKLVLMPYLLGQQ